MNQLGTFLRLRPDLVQAHRVSTWRLRGSGDVLGFTYQLDGEAILVATINEKSSGANFSPLPESPPPFTLAEVQSWTLAEALEKIDTGQVPGYALNAFLEPSGLSRRTTWREYTQGIDLDREADPESDLLGVYVATGNVRGLVPVDLLLTGARKILIDRSEIVATGTRLEPSKYRVDGKEHSTRERLRMIFKDADAITLSDLTSQNRTQLDTTGQSD